MGDTMHNVPRTTMRTRMGNAATAAATAAPPSPHDRRRHRAAVAARLLALAPDTAAIVEWADLDAAPTWLALNDTDFTLLQRRLGALVHAGDIRLWIDKARLAAARSALGEAFVQALLAQRDLDTLVAGTAAAARIDSAEQVRAGLQAAGSIVLLAALPQGALRRALAVALDPASAAASLGAELAQSLLGRALTLGLPAAPATPGAAGATSAGKPR
jgi:hypothetical protein